MDEKPLSMKDVKIRTVTHTLRTAQELRDYLLDPANQKAMQAHMDRVRVDLNREINALLMGTVQVDPYWPRVTKDFGESFARDFPEGLEWAASRPATYPHGLLPVNGPFPPVGP